MSTSQGKFVWYDLMTTDLKAAEAFYQEVLGWKTKDSGLADRTYSIASIGDAMIGGLMPIPKDAGPQQRPCWMGYIGVDDVDSFVLKVKAAGGAIHHPPTDIPGIGRFAVAADPHNASFILFSSPNQPQFPPPGVPGHIGWRELHTGDVDTAFSFYAGLFGWVKTEAVDMGAAGIYQTFSAAGVPTGGMIPKAPQIPAPFWLFYFNVETIDSAVERVAHAGGMTYVGPHPIPGDMWMAICSDPQEAPFALLSAKR